MSASDRGELETEALLRDAGRGGAEAGGLAAGGTTTGQALLREERSERLLEALDRLAPPDREVLVMRYLEELTFAEVAAILGIGEGAAKMRHLRALRRIRALMEGDAP